MKYVFMQRVGDGEFMASVDAENGDEARQKAKEQGRLMSREEVAAHMREMGMTTTTDRVLAAIQERANKVNVVNYGTVTVRIQAGKVQVVEVSETFKPAPEHEVTAWFETTDTGEWLINCRCGAQLRGPTYRIAEAAMQDHINQSK